MQAYSKRAIRQIFGYKNNSVTFGKVQDGGLAEVCTLCMRVSVTSAYFFNSADGLDKMSFF